MCIYVFMYASLVTVEVKEKTKQNMCMYKQNRNRIIYPDIIFDQSTFDCCNFNHRHISRISTRISKFPFCGRCFIFKLILYSIRNGRQTTINAPEIFNFIIKRWQWIVTLYCFKCNKLLLQITFRGGGGGGGLGGRSGSKTHLKHALNSSPAWD